jgi:hypothetical protein
VASLLTSVKAATTEFLASDIFHRLFESCLAACLSAPALLLRDGLHLLLVLLDEFSNSRPGGGGIPYNILIRMGRFLIQAAHWSTAPANEETAETLRLQILRLLARLPARTILTLCAASNGEESGRDTAAEKTASWELEDSLVLQKILAAEFSIDSITAAEVKDFLGYLNVAAGEEAAAADVLSCGGLVEELEAAYPAVQSASLRAAWLSWTTAGYLVFNKLRSPLGSKGLKRISRTRRKNSCHWQNTEIFSYSTFPLSLTAPPPLVTPPLKPG